MMKDKPHWYFLSIILIITAIAISPCTADQQRFRVQPQGLQVLEGSEALLRCEITNLGGAVQWTKDGFALGFQEKIPGYPRYSVLGQREHGVYNLRISNASLDDDAEFQCQVGPAKLMAPIRANANLTVISPPSSIEIQGYAHNSKVEVRENKDLKIECIVANAKPPALIQWYRGNVELKSNDNRQDRIVSVGKRYNSISELRIKPTAQDDYVEYSCQAKHKALQPDNPMKATIQVSVLYPPGEPYIEGFQRNDKLKRGQNVQLACKSHGGNPPAQLIWYKNDVQVQMSYRSSGRSSESIYAFTVEAHDNKARLRCEASNVISEKPLKKEIDLNVIFPPTQVTITGPAEARVSEKVRFQCGTAPSNPPAEIRWMIDGKYMNSSTITSPGKDGGMISNSTISFAVKSNKRSYNIACNGLNMDLPDHVFSTHTLNVLYPPSTPMITGYTEGSILKAGVSTKLLCSSQGGNPPALLTWFKNDKKVNSKTKTIGDSVQSELVINANITDNQARYRCEAQNSATDVPLFETKTLSVHFLPETLKIFVEPRSLTPGTEAKLYCNSSSSNPPVELSWFNDGIPMEGGVTTVHPGLFGGKSASSIIKLNVTQDMNDVKITCQGKNRALDLSINEAINLQVLYPPKFTPPPSSKAVGIEDEPMIITMIASGNPSSIQYTWTKEGSPIEDHIGDSQRITFDGPNLNFTRLARNDTGVYTCEAVNSQGSTTINISVIVEYGASIKSISENAVVNPGEEAVLSCLVDGYPLNEAHVRWERVDYNMNNKTYTTYDNGTSFLHIKDARRKDIGNFRCIADNRVANPISRDVLLIVKFIPEIDKSPTMLRAAANKGDKARLQCRVQAAPQPLFIWSRKSNVLNVTHNAKYNIENRKIDSLTYESTLIVEKVDSNDYGLYECKAENELGSSRENVKMDITSMPDQPLSLNVLNSTYDSVTLSWTPGFDGGLKAKYRIRYREANNEQYKFEDAMPNSHKLTIVGLKKNTLYLFSVMAYNSLGSSQYMADLTKAYTKVAPPASPSVLTTEQTATTGSPFMKTSTGLLLLIGISSGTGLVLINILLIACCLHKRHKKNLKGEPVAHADVLSGNDEMPKLLVFGIALVGLGLLLANTALVAWFIVRKKIKEPSTVPNSKSAAIEMYAPSSYNDTVTGETLSSVSDKSDSYSNDGSQPDLTEDANRKTTSTYVVEDSDIPPPRYQKDGRLSPYYQSNSNINQMMTLSGHHPKMMAQLPQVSFAMQPSYEEQIMNQTKNYVKIPSPGPPLDGSYYNMQSDRYLSYPPMDPIEFPVASAIHLSGQDMSSRNNTLNRRNSNLINHNMQSIPPPDVTHHTTKFQPMQLKPPQLIGMNSLMDTSQQPTQTLFKHPPSILKDPKRNQQQHQQQQQQVVNHLQNVNKDLQMHQNLMHHPSIMTTSTGDVVITGPDGPQTLGTQSVLIPYDATNTNLNSFNASLGFPETDGHLV